MQTGKVAGLDNFWVSSQSKIMHATSTAERNAQSVCRVRVCLYVIWVIYVMTFEFSTCILLGITVTEYNVRECTLIRGGNEIVI